MNCNRGYEFWLAKQAKAKRESGLAESDKFLEAQMRKMGLSSGALEVERKHRYKRGDEKPSSWRRPRNSATPPAPPELHLGNHERLLEKYKKSLVPANDEPELLGSRTPVGDKTPYRALVALEAFAPGDALADAGHAWLEDRFNALLPAA